MLDPTDGADYTIWIVAALLYVSDAAKLLSPRQLLLVEAGRGRLAAAFSATPYTIAGRVLSFAPLLLPYRGVFVAPWGSAWTDGARLKKVLESLERLRGSLRGARLLVATAAADVKTEFLSRLESRTEEAIEETDPDDPAQANLRTYLATVRGAR